MTETKECVKFSIRSGTGNSGTGKANRGLTREGHGEAFRELEALYFDLNGGHVGIYIYINSIHTTPVL